MRSEDAIVSAVRRAFRGNVGAGALDLRDDAALLPPTTRGHTRIVSTDVVVEEVDFALDLYPAEAAGHRAMLQNLSDLAAMGATPRGFVWSLAVPDRWSAPEGPLGAFLRGAARLSRRFGAALYGGDLSSTAGPFSASVTIFGDVKGAPLLRSGAMPGDTVYVSPAGVGAAGAGLRLLLGRRKTPRSRARGSFEAFLASLHAQERSAVHRYLGHTPDLALGQALVGRATSCIDVSDGLGRDLQRIARASGVRIELDAEALGAARCAEAPEGLSADALLDSAEEYVLAYTSRAPVPGIPIGRVRRGAGLFVDGQPVRRGGFDHFEARAPRDAQGHAPQGKVAQRRPGR